MINDKNKFIFVHIPKTGGISIFSAFSFLGLADKTYPKHIIDRINKDNCKDFEGYFKFAFHRNPWDRMVSFWKYWTVQRHPKALISLKILEKYPEAENLEGFCYNLHNIFSDFLQKDFYTLNQVKLNGQSDYIKIDFWGRFEHLDTDFKVICKRLNIPYVELPIQNTTIHQHYKMYYNYHLRKYIAKLYEEDIDTFKYTF
jgi:hypothetical protein